MYTSHVARFALVLLSCRSGVRHTTSARGNAALLVTPAAPASSARGTAAPLASPVVPAFFPACSNATSAPVVCHCFFGSRSWQPWLCLVPNRVVEKNKQHISCFSCLSHVRSSCMCGMHVLQFGIMLAWPRLPMQHLHTSGTCCTQ